MTLNFASMSGIHWLLVFVALLGFLPLGIYIYKVRLVRRILKKGLPVKASVYKIVRHVIKNTHVDIVHYSFIAWNGIQHTGKLTSGVDKYRVRDTVEIYYLPANPRHNTVKGAWVSPIILIFLLLLTAFVLFAVYKINEMVQTGAA
jgi:hypothetical protein